MASEVIEEFDDPQLGIGHGCSPLGSNGSRSPVLGVVYVLLHRIHLFRSPPALFGGEKSWDGRRCSLALASHQANLDAPRRYLGVFLLAHEIKLGGPDIGVAGDLAQFSCMVAPFLMASLIAVLRGNWMPIPRASRRVGSMPAASQYFLTSRHGVLRSKCRRASPKAVTRVRSSGGRCGPWARVTEAGPEGQQPVCARRPSMMKESLSPQLPVC